MTIGCFSRLRVFAHTCPKASIARGDWKHCQAATSFSTLNSCRLCLASHKSYWACWLSQLSAEVSNAIDRRIAISGLMPARPFKIADNVLRLTPSASAALVTVRPSGSKHNFSHRTTKSRRHKGRRMDGSFFAPLCLRAFPIGFWLRQVRQRLGRRPPPASSARPGRST